MGGGAGDGARDRGGQAIAFASPAEPGVPMVAAYVLPAEPLRGYLLRLSCRVKAENVSAKPQPWNGIKFMLIVSYEGGKTCPQPRDRRRQLRLETGGLRCARADRRDGRCGCPGPRERHREGMVRRHDDHGPEAALRAGAGGDVGTVYTGHDLPRLRGAMVSPDIDEAGLRTLGKDWNANLIRWQLVGMESQASRPGWRRRTSGSKAN